MAVLEVATKENDGSEMLSGADLPRGTVGYDTDGDLVMTVWDGGEYAGVIMLKSKRCDAIVIGELFPGHSQRIRPVGKAVLHIEG